MKRLFVIMLSVAVALFQVMPVLAAPVKLSDNDMDGVVAGYIEENTLTLTDDAQREFEGLSNVNDVDSAVSVQSHATFGGFDVTSTNDATVNNIDGDSGDDITSDNTLSINEQAQMDLKALSNVNSVDSAAAVQSNITVGATFPINNNYIEVDNIDGDSEGKIRSGNYLTLSGDAQGTLYALSNLNSVDSAVGVQSNFNVGGVSVSNLNIGEVDNFNGDAGNEDTLDDLSHSLLITDQAQKNLMAFSNVNSVDSAVLVQMNTSIDIEDYANSINDGTVTNNSTNLANYMDRDNDLSISGDGQANLDGVCNINAIDTAVLAQINITVLGGTVAANDYNTAYTVINDDGTTSGAGWDRDTNNLTLTGNAQKGLSALHNANLVDSATAIEGNYTAFGDSGFRANEAYITNKDKDSYIYASVNRMNLSGDAQQGLDSVSNMNACDSAAAVQTNISYKVNSLISDNYAELTNDDGVCYDWIDTDNGLSISGNAQKNLNVLSNVNSVDSASLAQFNLATLGASDSKSINEAVVINTDGESTNGYEWGISYNYLTLSGDAQRGLIAESNINEVDSATAVQTNITVEDEEGTPSELTSSNIAEVDNLDIIKGEGVGSNNGIRSYNKLILSGDAQRSLQALSNINSVDSANAVQTNITANRGSAEMPYIPDTGIPIEYEALEIPTPCCNGSIELVMPAIPGIEPGEYTELGDVITSTNYAEVDNIDGTAYWMDVLTGEIMNLLTLSDDTQRELSALSNLNSMDSANAVQTNIVYAKGAGVNSNNTATVKNDDGTTDILGSIVSDGISDDTNRLMLSSNAQKDLQALSNANTVDSANAVQTNITVEGTGITQSNVATVTNEDREVRDERRVDPVNILSITGSAQIGLTALSNLNSVNSANAVQSNYAIGANVTSSNTATVRNINNI